MTQKKRTTRSSPATKTTTTTPMTDAQLKTLIAHGVADVLTERDATRRKNGEDNPDSGTGELALMCVRMFPEESDKIEKYIGGLPDMIHGSIGTLVERQVESKRKLDNNNQAQQQPSKKQGVAIAYIAGPDERKEYTGTLLIPAATNNQRNPTCYECGNQGHCRSDCSKLKNQNHRNQAGDTRARGMVHALGGGETN
nr:hypothetical protein [Tanacetum cinerariifolium]